MAYAFVKATGQSLSIADTASLRITGAITMACWAKRSSDLTTQQHLINKYNGTGNQRGYLMGILATSGRLIGRFARDGSASFVVGTDSANAVPATMSHLCTTLVPNEYPNLYINGAIDNGAISGSTNASIHASTATLAIGANSSTTNSYYDGDIAEVGIWNVALTAAEVASLAQGVACRLVRPQSLVFYAPLIRDLIDVRGGLAITNNNTATVANHPRIYA